MLAKNKRPIVCTVVDLYVEVPRPSASICRVGWEVKNDVAVVKNDTKGFGANGQAGIEFKHLPVWQ